MRLQKMQKETNKEEGEKKLGKLIHLAQIILPRKGERLLLLRKDDPVRYVWYEEYEHSQEHITSIFAPSAEESIRLAYLNWKDHIFRTINCGFRYSLPERDEHGTNALFNQMVASYSSMNGIYFDEDVGHNCIVNFASDEAKKLWKDLQSQKRL
jgi:hypothetical protein